VSFFVLKKAKPCEQRNKHSKTNHTHFFTSEFISACSTRFLTALSFTLSLANFIAETNGPPYAPISNTASKAVEVLLLFTVPG
jgi:hypothetical protein